MNRLQYKSHERFERRKQVEKPTLSNPQRSIITRAAILEMRLYVCVCHYGKWLPKNSLRLRKCVCCRKIAEKIIVGVWGGGSLSVDACVGRF